MTKPKKPKYIKRPPANRRIPFEHGTFTRTAEDLYDLIFFYGLGGCYMSNRTLSHKIRCSRRSVQYARQQLVRNQVIITVRVAPKTWMMWARFHSAVMNCPVLRHSKSKKAYSSMDNPFYVEKTNSKPAQGGAKIAPNSDVVYRDYSLRKGFKKEAAENTQQLDSKTRGTNPLENPRRGSAPAPRKHSLLDRQGHSEGLSIDKTKSSGPTIVEVSPDLTEDEKHMFEEYLSKLLANGRSPSVALNLATYKINAYHKKTIASSKLKGLLCNKKSKP